MNLAISNIAWQRSEDPDVLALLVERGVRGLEVAPTRLWDDPLSVPDDELQRFREDLEGRGIGIVALQSLLYQQPELTVFGSDERRARALEHLGGMLRFGGRLGARALVFGSPKNRFVGDLSPDAALEIAVPFFRRLGEVALEHGTCFCIEPNPPRYGCDYVNTSLEALELVQAVDCEGFGLHLDAAGMTLAGEDIEANLPLTIPHARHFHISERDLGPVGDGDSVVRHGAFAAKLAQQSYERWLSIEMRPGDEGQNLARVRAALDFVQATYRAVGGSSAAR